MKIISLTQARFRNSVLTTLRTAIWGKIRTNASAIKGEELTQIISMTLRLNLALNYSTIATIREKIKFSVGMQILC